MRRVVAFLVVAALVIGVAWWGSSLPGAISLDVGSVNMTTSAPVALLLAVLLFVVLYLIVRIAVAIIRLPSRTRRLRAERNRRRGDAAVTQTLLALAGGDPDTARDQAHRGRALLGDTPQTLLLAAYADRQAGDETKAAAVFEQLAGRKDAAFLGLRGLMQGAMARGDWEAANALAARAATINPDAPWLRAERRKLAIQAGSWNEALGLAGNDEPVAALATAAAEAEPDIATARRLAQRAWKTDRGFAPAALVYARRLREAGRDKRAQAVLRESWVVAPHPAIAAASLTGGGFMSAEGRAAWLTAENPGHPESRLVRAQAALDAGNLPDARAQADAALAGGLEERRVWLLIAAIAGQSADEVTATEALRRAATAPADAHWRCDACGTPHAEWHPACPNCGAAGRITWGAHTGGPVARPALTAGMGDAILP